MQQPSAYWRALKFIEKDVFTAMRLLERALELAPHFVQARDDYAAILTERGDFTDAAVQTGLLLAEEPRNVRYRTLHANAAMHVGDYDTALDLLTDLLRESFPPMRVHGCSMPRASAFSGAMTKAFRHCVPLPGF